jgi:hypothetical protein
MNKFGDAIEYLREADKGRNGPLEEAAECIEELLGENAELRELAYPTPIVRTDEIRRKQQAGAARHWMNRGK